MSCRVQEAQLAYLDAAAHRVNADSFGGFFPSIGLNISEHEDGDIEPTVYLDTAAFDAMRGWAAVHLGWRRWSLPLTGAMFGGKVSRDSLVWKFASPLGTSHFATVGPDVSAQVFLNGSAGSELQFSPRFLSLFRSVYGTIVQHLRQHGWLTNTSVLFLDEPAWSDPETLAIWLKLAALWKSAFPELHLYQTFNTPAPEQVLYMLDQACVHVAVYRGGFQSGSGARGAYAALLANVSRATGLELTIYSNELAIIDLPAGAIRMRTFPWMIWSTGVLNNITAGGGLRGFMQTAINAVGHLSPSPWIEANAYPGHYNISGLWYMTYPDLDSDVNGTLSVLPPVPSIRWEMLRQGLEDIERFVLLAGLVESARHECQAHSRAQVCDAAKEGWAALQSVSSAVWDFSYNFGFEEVEYTHDPGRVESVLSRVGSAIEEILQLGVSRGQVAAHVAF